MPFQEKTVIEPKYDVKLVGRIIRYYRKKRKWSVSNFAKTNYVEKSYLSEIELGKKYADLETLANIFKSLGICYDFSNELYHEIRSDFLLYYKAVVYQNNEYANQIFNRNVGDDKRLFSDGFIYVYLIKLIAHVVYDEEQEDICEILNILREFEDVMDEMCLQVYYDYLGVYMARENRTSALNLFELALTKSNREIYKSMIYFHIARVESDQYKFLNAFENLQKAKELFNSELNVRRSIQCEIMIAVIFIRNNYYKEADERLTKLLIDIPDYAENERKTVINNMIWNHMKNGYVILGNKLIHDYYKDKISSKCLFYLCWGYYKQLDYENFNLYFNRLKSLELDNLLIRVVECCKEFFDLGSKEILLDRFVNLLKICDKQKLPNIQELLIGDVIDLANDLKNMDALVYALTLKSTIYTYTE